MSIREIEPDKPFLDQLDAQRREIAAPPRSLIRKVAEIMGEVERVAKNGRNDFHKYDYATESDIAAAVRSGMAKRGLALFPSVEKTDFTILETGKGGKLRLCTLTVRFTLEDSESGEARSFVIIGEGSDSGDKATYKAMTGAEKYALLKLFLIPTGDDPEQEALPAKVREIQNPETGEVVEDPESPPHPAEVRVAPAEDPVIEIGRDKTKRLSQVKDLSWLRGFYFEGVQDPEKAHYKAKNQKWLAAIDAELKRRADKDRIPF